METIDSAKTNEGSQDKQQLTLTVHAPRSPDPRTFTWAKTLKVTDAARNAAEQFGYKGGNPGLQLLGGQIPRALDNNKPLVAEHLKDGDELELVDTGGGV